MCYDGDPNTVERHECRRARKAYECFACREPIAIGHRYHVTACLDDGRWYTVRHCLRCYLILEALWLYDGGPVQWDLNCGETWEEPPEAVAALAFLTPAEAQAWQPQA